MIIEREGERSANEEERRRRRKKKEKEEEERQPRGTERRGEEDEEEESRRGIERGIGWEREKRRLPREGFCSRIQRESLRGRE